MSHSTVLLARVVVATLLAAHGAGPASAQTAVARATVHQLRPPHSATGEISITALPVKKSWDVFPCRPQAGICTVPVIVDPPVRGNCVISVPDIYWINDPAAELIIWTLLSRDESKATFTFRRAPSGVPSHFGIELLDTKDYGASKDDVWEYFSTSDTTVTKKIKSLSLKVSAYSIYVNYKLSDGTVGECPALDPLIVNQG